MVITILHIEGRRKPLDAKFSHGLAITQWQTFEFLYGSIVAVCGRTFQRLCFGRDMERRLLSKMVHANVTTIGK